MFRIHRMCRISCVRHVVLSQSCSFWRKNTFLTSPFVILALFCRVHSLRVLFRQTHTPFWICMHLQQLCCQCSARVDAFGAQPKVRIMRRAERCPSSHTFLYESKKAIVCMCLVSTTMTIRVCIIIRMIISTAGYCYNYC